MARNPDFICIGAQKSGTTWLYRVLSRHPGIYMPPGRKEVHYFDRLIFKHPFEWYQSLFEDPSGDAIVAGEKTPCYAHLKRRSIRLIQEVLPDVKLILLLRRPDERAWSQARMEVSQYNKRTLGPTDLWKCVFHLGLLRNRRRTRYDRILKRWRAAFRREQLFVAYYDDVERDPHGLLGRILAFLEAPGAAELPEGRVRSRVWQSPAFEMPAAVRWYLKRKYRSVTRFLEREDCAAAAPSRDPSSESIHASWWDKAKVWLAAEVATLPYNLAYICYDLVRDLRMTLRIRTLKRSMVRSGHEQGQAVKPGSGGCTRNDRRADTDSGTYARKSAFATRDGRARQA